MSVIMRVPLVTGVRHNEQPADLEARMGAHVSDMLNAVCLNYWHTARTSMHTPQDMPQEVSSQYPSPEQTMGGAQYYIDP